MRNVVVVISLSLCACGLSGCEGLVKGPGGGATLDPNTEVGVSGIRRLSRVELDQTLADVLGDTASPAQQHIAPDPTNPYDNEFKQQLPSAALIESLERIATEVADRLIASPTRFAEEVGCTPQGPSDAACLRSFVETFGLRALRRPLTEDEVLGFLGLQTFAVEANDFKVGVKLVVMAMLQEPEFVYRVEIGTPVAGREGVQKLNDWHVASRLSYFLWGTTPPPWLLDAAKNGQLQTSAGVRSAAQRLIDDPRAQANVERFHALWLAYHRLPHAPNLTSAMQAESAALVTKVVFQDKGDYFDLFTSEQTYINQTLATHYGITVFSGGATGFAWTPYRTAPRKGILSHGSVLSAGAKFSDTSPTQRGIFIRERLFCQSVPPPPPGVNVDEIPSSPTSNCKIDRYSAHASVGGCKSCHQNFDPVGFGIENFNRAGQFRATDDGQPSCAISGQGELTGLPGGTQAFQGVVGLADLMVGSGDLEACTVKQVYRFAMGRREEAFDLGLLDKLTASFKDHNRSFQGLLLDLVSDETFAFRRDE
ncbi:MAG: DUF1592 domain-containing protein [Myxococcaceae bacterium]|nr:DUF1592 domain-containing protein [Myxococcaceae bacterium]